MKNIKELNQQFGIGDNVKFDLYKDTFPAAYINNNAGQGILSLYGANVLSYQPKGEKEILWMSQNSFMEAGKAIRGGIPVCFPWFGPHLTDNTKPMHGFARLLMWSVEKTEQLADDSTCIILSLHSSEESMQLWPYSFNARLIVIFGKKLEVSLEVVNNGAEKFSYSEALHTYYNISDTSNIVIHGLGNTKYYDGLNKDAENIQENNELYIQKEENRRHYNHSGACVIEDKKWNRKINVSKKNSNVTLVWNPWIETAKKFADMPDDGYKTMVCIEAVNYYNDTIQLAPGEKHTLTAVVELNG